MNKVSLFFILIFCFLVSCSAIEEDKLEEGRCAVNSDCKQGMECANTFCEDIYYPRRTIKTY